MNKMINIKGIIWLNVTRQCQKGETFIQEIMNNFTLFILHDDNTYEQVEFVEEVVEAIALDLKIIIYVGNEKKQSWFPSHDHTREYVCFCFLFLVVVLLNLLLS